MEAHYEKGFIVVCVQLITTAKATAGKCSRGNDHRVIAYVRTVPASTTANRHWMSTLIARRSRRFVQCMGNVLYL